MPELVYLIDVYSLVFQVFHAIPEMTGPQGLPTNAVFGFTRDILNILRQKRPTHVLCATDPSGPGEREKVFPAYKATRSETPAELRPQFPMIAETIRAFGIPILEVPGWEADDVIATAVDAAVKRGMEVCIVSNDKDARQLLGPHVRIYYVRKDQFIGEAELRADWGIRPDQVVDFQSLVGDSVDNVPGVPLVGPKKASALLQQWGTLDEVLAHADQAPGAKLRENLKTFADQARVSRRLVTLRRDLPLTIDWDAARVGHWDADRLQRLFREYGFRRFGDEVRELVSERPQAAPSPPLRKGGQGGADRVAPQLPFSSGESEPSTKAHSVADSPAEPHPQPPLPKGGRVPVAFTVVDTAAKLADLVAQLTARRQFCLDLRTTGSDAMRADIIGWAFSWDAAGGYYVPVRGPEGQRRLEQEYVVEALRPILEHPQVEVVNQDVKRNVLVLRRARIALRGIGVDPMVGSYLLEAGARSHSLDELARNYLNHELTPIADLIGKGLFEKRLEEVDISQMAEYAVERAAVAWELATLIAEQLRAQGLWDLYWDLERPLIEVLAEMQYNGIRVDVERLHAQGRDVEQRLGGIRQQIYALAGREFNIDSPKQLQTVLFKELDLPVMRKNKTGPSTDQDVLEQLAGLHPLPSKIVEHRGLAKLKNTYLDALPVMVNPETGKVHTSFNQVVAATGRLSSHDPNLQNIPVRTAEGRQVRQAFVPSVPEWKIVCADYSQIELRMLAHFSGDPVLREAFHQGGDIHETVAAEIYGVPPAEVDGEMRRVAKAVNFGVIYGQSPFGLAASLGISKAQAATFIESYFTRYAGVDRFLEELLRECLRTGYATTILGRRRRIEGIRTTPHPNRQRNLPERTAINTVIQGSAADLIKRAMINVSDRLKHERHPARLLLQIHDELVLESPAERVADLAAMLRQEMEQALPLSVPLRVDLSAGPNWLDLASIDQPGTFQETPAGVEPA